MSVKVQGACRGSARFSHLVEGLSLEGEVVGGSSEVGSHGEAQDHAVVGWHNDGWSPIVPQRDGKTHSSPRLSWSNVDVEI